VKFYTTGSYRLGLKDPNTDIDIVCVCPSGVTHSDFFTQLHPVLEQYKDKVKNVVSVPEAKVPMIEFEYEDVFINLMLAILPMAELPEDLDISNDEILRNVDEGSQRALNGARDTHLIMELVPNHETFLTVLRCVRAWAKQRGLYSNKLGFLGGVNWAILTAFVCKLHPKAIAATILHKFWWWMKEWSWPRPVRINSSVDAGLGKRIWDPKTNPNDAWDVMPIITPAYPAFNSSFNVSQATLQILKEEFESAFTICNQVIRNESKEWDLVLANTDFSVRYDYYLQVTISAENEENFRSWSGWVQSRMRKLVYLLEGYSELTRIQPYPKVLHSEDEETTAWHFIGFEVDESQLYDGVLPLDCTSFIDEINWWSGILPDMYIDCEVIRWEDLPAAIHPDGLEAALQLRATLKPPPDPELYEAEAEAEAEAEPEPEPEAEAEADAD